MAKWLSSIFKAPGSLLNTTKRKRLNFLIDLIKMKALCTLMSLFIKMLFFSGLWNSVYPYMVKYEKVSNIWKRSRKHNCKLVPFIGSNCILSSGFASILMGFMENKLIQAQEFQTFLSNLFQMATFPCTLLKQVISAYFTASLSVL